MLFCPEAGFLGASACASHVAAAACLPCQGRAPEDVHTLLMSALSEASLWLAASSFCSRSIRCFSLAAAVSVPEATSLIATCTVTASQALLNAHAPLHGLLSLHLRLPPQHEALTWSDAEVVSAAEFEIASLIAASQPQAWKDQRYQLCI